MAGQLLSLPIVVGMAVVVLVWLGGYGYRYADQLANTPLKLAPKDNGTSATTSSTLTPLSGNDVPTFEEPTQGGERHE